MFLYWLKLSDKVHALFIKSRFLIEISFSFELQHFLFIKVKFNTQKLNLSFALGHIVIIWRQSVLFFSITHCTNNEMIVICEYVMKCTI